MNFNSEHEERKPVTGLFQTMCPVDAQDELLKAKAIERMRFTLGRGIADLTSDSRAYYIRMDKEPTVVPMYEPHEWERLLGGCNSYLKWGAHIYLTDPSEAKVGERVWGPAFEYVARRLLGENFLDHVRHQDVLIATQEGYFRFKRHPLDNSWERV